MAHQQAQRMMDRMLSWVALCVMIWSSSLAYANTDASVQNHLLSNGSLQLTEEEQAYLRDHPVIALGNDIDWAPFEFIDAQGRFDGMAAAYFRRFEQILGVQFTINTTKPWSEILQMAIGGQISVLSSVVPTPERSQHFNFTRAYLTFPMVLVARAGEHYVESFAELSSRQRIAVVRGYWSEDFLKQHYPQLPLLVVDSITQGLEAVLTGKAYALSDNLGAIHHAIAFHGLSGFQVIGQSERPFALSIGVRKSEPVLFSILQKALDQVSVQEAREIYQRWHTLTVATPALSSTTRLYDAYGIAFILWIGSVILAGLGWRYRHLWRRTTVRTPVSSQEEAQASVRLWQFLAHKVSQVRSSKRQTDSNSRHLSLSLRQYLLWFLLGLFLLMGGSMLLIAYWGAQQSITQFGVQLSEQSAKSVEMKLERFFAGGLALVKANQDMLLTGAFSLDDKPSLQQLFVSQMKHFPYATFISGADRNGEYIGATRTPETNDIQIMTASVQNDRKLTFYSVGQDNLLGDYLRSAKSVDMRDRPWYQQAVQTQKVGWYPVYKYLPYKGLGIGVVAPVFSRETGAFDGVVAVDLALDQVSSFLRSMDVGAHGVSFLVDDKGNLAATNLTEPVYTGDAVAGKQLTLTAYPDARLQAVASIVQPEGQFNLQVDGRDYVLHKRVIRDDHGLYFVIGVLLAIDGFEADFYRQLWLVAGVFVVMMLIGLLLMRYFSDRLISPVERQDQGNHD